MEVRYSIELDSVVLNKDLPHLDASWRGVIRDAVRERLKTAPALYGKPLRQELKGYWKLRVGDYRVVYQIQAKVVRIIAITHRSSDYREVRKRL